MRHASTAAEAASSQARGAVLLAEGDPHGALTSLRHSFRLWMSSVYPTEPLGLAR